MSTVNRTISCLLAIWLLTTSVGCATINLSKIDFRSRKATARNPAIKIVCLWEPAEGRDPKGIPCQGFAGQILFLTGKSLPVSVEGDIKVYLFDDHGTAEEQSKPIHEFNFDTEAWAQHYSYGSLGPCYNVFIPYMRKGTNDATCALRLRLTPPEGQGPPVFSEMTSIELLGYADGKKGPVKSSSANDSRVEQTTPEDLTSVNNRRRTTTIVLNAKDGVPGNATENAQPSSASPVQQASYQAEDVKPMTEADARMAQLEQMVRELKSLQRLQPGLTVKQDVPAMPPRLLDEGPVQQPTENRTRIKMRSMETTTDDEAGSAQPQQVADESGEARTTRHKPSTTERRPHPLDDEAPVEMKPIAKNAAPRRRAEISFDDDAPVKQTAPRHPLDDDVPAPKPAKPAPARKTVRALELGSKSDRNVVEQPFTPIDIEQTEASAVEVAPSRVRLRSANN